MTGRPTPITIVPYVYKDGDDEPRRRSPRLAQKATAVVGRKSARLAASKVLVATATALDNEADSETALVSSPRKRKVLDYKSIVRTRAQKAANIKLN